MSLSVGIGADKLWKNLVMRKYLALYLKALKKKRICLDLMKTSPGPVERDRLMQHAIQGGATQQLALDWVEAYEREKRLRRVIAERGELPKSEEGEEEEEAPIQYPDCFLCGESGKYLRLTSQYVCVKCIDELNQKMEEARHASDQES